MKVGVDREYGLVVIQGDLIAPVSDVVGVPSTERDPLRWLLEHPDRDALLDQAGKAKADLPLVVERLAPPIARPPKIIAAPVNYLDHKVEMKEQSTIADYGVFLKAPTSVIGPGGVIELPYLDKRIDQEGELAVIIGRSGRNIPRESAFDYIFGYCCLLDISMRSTEDRSTRKSFDTFTPIGPWVTTRDEISDVGALDLVCSVNDSVRQNVSTADLIYDVPLLVAYASSVMTLEVGDIIATGTPAGVGSLNDGDRVRVHIDGLGALEVGVSAAAATLYSSRPGWAPAVEPA